MPGSLDDHLRALSAETFSGELEGLEDSVLGRLAARRAAAQGGPILGLRVGLTLAALAFGLAMGAAGGAKPVHLSELGVLSDDGLMAPSVRLGGGL